MDLLIRIKRLVLEDKLYFTQKATDEMARDGLTNRNVKEALLNAPAVRKKLRSANPASGKREILYVIVGLTYDGIPVYTKGKISNLGGREVFYVLISSKRSSAN
jgi:hypothetical protein